MIRIIIVDDHQMFIDGLKELINTMSEIEVVGEANNGIEMIDLLSKVEADVILMDINMPKMDGLEATKHVKKHYPDLMVLMLSMHDSEHYIQKLLKAGASGYILKNTGKSELEEAIYKVASGNTYYSQAVTQTIMQSLHKQEKAKDSLSGVQLTEREKDVLRLIVQELTTQEIADQLFISHHTVESHRKNLIAKIGVRSSAGLVKYAIQSGLVD